MVSSSKAVLDNTEMAVLSNTGYTSALHKSLKPDKDTKKQMKEKIVHNHTKGNIISTALIDKHHGDMKTTEVNSSNPIKLHSVKA